MKNLHNNKSIVTSDFSDKPTFSVADELASLAPQGSMGTERENLHQILLKPASRYVFYALKASTPALYAAIHMLSHTQLSYLWQDVERHHLQTDELPSHVTEIISVSRTDAGEFGPLVKSLLQKDPEAAMTLYVTDNHLDAVWYQFIYEGGLAQDKLTIELITDGSYSADDYLYRYGNGSYRVYDEVDSTRNKIIKKTLNLLGLTHKNPVKKIAKERAMCAEMLANPALLRSYDSGFNYALMALNPRVRLWLAHSASIMHLPAMAGEQATMKIITVPLATYYAALSHAQQAQVQRMFGFKKELFDPYFNAQHVKPALIVISALVSATRRYYVRPATWRAHMSLVAQRYGATHRLFLKAHPAAPISDEDQALLTSLGFEKSPAMPFPLEIMLMVYPHLCIGGYESTIFMSVAPQQALFLFSPPIKYPLQRLIALPELKHLLIGF